LFERVEQGEKNEGMKSGAGEVGVREGGGGYMKRYLV